MACLLIQGLVTSQHGMAVTLQGGCTASTCRKTQIGPDVRLLDVPNPVTAPAASCVVGTDMALGCRCLQSLPQKQLLTVVASAGSPWLQPLDGAATGSCCSLKAPSAATAGCQWVGLKQKAKRLLCGPQPWGQADSLQRRACSSRSSSGQQGTLHRHQSCSCQRWLCPCCSCGPRSCTGALQPTSPE